VGGGCEKSNFDIKAMKLIIFRGAASPDHPDYQPVYSLLEEMAARHGFEIDLSVRWPGQSKDGGTKQ
jgi:hypothetical protein